MIKTTNHSVAVIALGLNAILLVALLVSPMGDRQETNSAAKRPAGVQPQVPPRDPRGPLKPLTSDPGRMQPFHWSQLESTNFHEYVANLREVGCPEETVRDLVVAEINKLYARRCPQARKSVSENKYWEGWKRQQACLQVSGRKELRGLERERREVLREILGDVPESEFEGRTEESARLSRQISFLPAEKREAALAVLEKYQDAEAEILDVNRGVLDAEDELRLGRIRQEKSEELKEVLSPIEFRQYELRHSEISRYLASQLKAFAPSEEEFGIIFDARKAYEEEFGPARTPGRHEGSEERRLAEQARVEEGLRARLGDDRYSEYVRAQDSAFQTLVDIQERYDLPRESILEVYHLKRDIEQFASGLQSNQDLTHDDQRAFLESALKDAEASISRCLGDRASAAYLHRGAAWLQNLKRPVVAPPRGVVRRRAW